MHFSDINFPVYFHQASQIGSLCEGVISRKEKIQSSKTHTWSAPSIARRYALPWMHNRGGLVRQVRHKGFLPYSCAR